MINFDGLLIGIVTIFDYRSVSSGSREGRVLFGGRNAGGYSLSWGF